MLSLLASGCLWRLGVNGKYFTQPGGATTIETTALRLDGYYWRPVDYPDSSRSAVPLLLWEDGTAALSYARYGRSHWFRLPHSQIVNALRGKTGERRSPINLQWGGFRVFGDSISIQVMERLGYKGIWDAYEYNGRIRDDTTFAITERIRPRQPLADGQVTELVDPPWVFHFQPLAPGEKPMSDNWTQTHEDLQ
ncbi:hypothetical protein [Longibacter salinarum]|uniref:hypothetical protein n=1 Tax=Longibacter salinarum TaxID=1850348 RepID=UPI0015CF6658|nr:hypothetical protein [Longibacter salinarum]